MSLKKFRMVAPGEEPETLWNLSFIMVLVLGFITGSANQMVNPLLSKYAVNVVGTSLSLAGTLMGLQSGMAMCLRPISGAASDILNRKHVMLVSIVASSLAYVGYLTFKTVAAIVVCRLLQGFSFAFMSVARTAFASEYIPKDRMGEGVAYTSFGIVLSQAIGPNIGLWVSEEFGYNGCFLIALILSVGGGVLLAFLPYQHKKGEFHWNKLKLSNLIAVEILPYGFLAGLFGMTIHLANSFLTLVGEERNIANVGLFFTVYSIIALVLRPASGKILDKFGLPVLLYPSFIFAALTMAFIGMAQSIVFIIIAGVCKALSQGVALPSIQGSALKRLGRERAGVTSATIHMAQDLLSTIAPAVGGVIATYTDYTTMYFIFAGIILLGIPMYAILRRQEKKRGIQ